MIFLPVGYINKVKERKFSCYAMESTSYVATDGTLLPHNTRKIQHKKPKENTLFWKLSNFFCLEYSWVDMFIKIVYHVSSTPL